MEFLLAFYLTSDRLVGDLLQVQDVEKRAEDLEGLEDEYNRRQADIAKHERDMARWKGEASEVEIEQSQTQAPDHSAELQALRTQKREAQTTVSSHKSVLQDSLNGSKKLRNCLMRLV